MIKSNLRKLMYENKIETIAELGRVTGVSRTSLVKIHKETNLSSIKLSTLARICEGIHCSLSELIEYTPSNI